MRRNQVINADDLRIIESGMLEIIGGVKMIEDFDLKVQLFFPLTFQATSEPAFFIEVKAHCSRYHQREEDGQVKTIVPFRIRYIHIHSKEAGDKCW